MAAARGAQAAQGGAVMARAQARHVSGTQVWPEPSEYVLSDVTAAVAPPESGDP